MKEMLKLIHKRTSNITKMIRFHKNAKFTANPEPVYLS